MERMERKEVLLTRNVPDGDGKKQEVILWTSGLLYKNGVPNLGVIVPSGNGNNGQKKEYVVLDPTLTVEVYISISPTD